MDLNETNALPEPEGTSQSDAPDISDVSNFDDDTFRAFDIGAIFGDGADADDTEGADSTSSTEGGAAGNTDGGIIIGDHAGFTFATGSGGMGLKWSLLFFPIVLLVGAAAGIFACYVHFFGLYTSPDHAAALTAAKAVYHHLNPDPGLPGLELETGDGAATPNASTVVFAEVFVNNKTAESECIVFVFVQDAPADFRGEVYRVVTDKSSRETQVFEAFDQSEYDRLNSGGRQERLLAGVMYTRKLEFERCLDEIRGGNPNWVCVDSFFLATRFRS